MLHRMSNSREYKAWQRAKARCYNPNVPYFQRYGGKGITVCEEWRDNFCKFLEDMGAMPDDCNSLKLIDESKEFCKYNCEWGKKASGRKKLPFQPKPPKKNKLNNPRTVCLVLENDLLQTIQNQALSLSVEKRKNIGTNELIRNVLNDYFKRPLQLDLFA